MKQLIKLSTHSPIVNQNGCNGNRRDIYNYTYEISETENFGKKEYILRVEPVFTTNSKSYNNTYEIYLLEYPSEEKIENSILRYHFDYYIEKIKNI